MSSIPLPALDLKPPQTPDVAGQFGNLLRLKALQQQSQQQAALAPLQQQAAQQQVQAGAVGLQDAQLQLQQRQQAVKDSQTLRTLSPQFVKKDADGKVVGYDFGGLFNAAASSGVSPQTLSAFQKSIADSTKAQADSTAAQRANQATLNKQAFNHLEGLRGTQDPTQRQQLWSAARTWAVQNAQALKINPAMLPAQAPDDNGLSGIEAALGMHAQQIDDATKLSGLRKANADASLAEQNSIFGPTGPAADSKYRFLEAKVIAKQPVSDADKNWMEAYKKQKLLVPVISGQVREQGYASSRLYPVFDNATKQTMYVSASDLNAMRAENPARYSPASYSPESIGQRDTTAYFTKGKGGQQLTAYNTALAHLDTLQSLAAALHNGDIQAINRVAQRFKQETGNPAPTNFEAAKNAMAGEVASALKTSGATDQEIEKVDQTFSRAQGPAQLDGAISTYRSLLNSKAHQLQGQYSAGMQGRPNFQPETQPQTGKPLTITLPSGKKITID